MHYWNNTATFLKIRTRHCRHHYGLVDSWREAYPIEEYHARGCPKEGYPMEGYPMGGYPIACYPHVTFIFSSQRYCVSEADNQAEARTAIFSLLSQFNGHHQLQRQHGSTLNLSALVALLATIAKSMIGQVLESGTWLCPDEQIPFLGSC